MAARRTVVTPRADVFIPTIPSFAMIRMSARPMIFAAKGNAEERRLLVRLPARSVMRFRDALARRERKFAGVNVSRKIKSAAGQEPKDARINAFLWLIVVPTAIARRTRTFVMGMRVVI